MLMPYDQSLCNHYVPSNVYAILSDKSCISLSPKKDKRFNYALHNDPPKALKEDNENSNTLKQSMMLNS